MEEFLDTARKQGVTIIEEPWGRPVFQFFLANGKTFPVLTFFDTGCSDAILREGVPGVQWEGVVKKQGPFHMLALIGTRVWTRDR